MPTYLDGTDNFDTGLGLGVGQSWVNETTSRALDTLYTNTTGKPIQIVVSVNPGAATTGTRFGIYAVVDGVNIGLVADVKDASYSGYLTHSFIVPNGETYKITTLTNAAIYSWFELKEVV